MAIASRCTRRILGISTSAKCVFTCSCVMPVRVMPLMLPPCGVSHSATERELDAG